MKIGILGTGDVGKALGRGFLELGHSVRIGGREPNNPKAMEWAKVAGSNASAGTFSQAAQFGEVVVLATHGTSTEAAIRAAGPEHFKGKLVLDATNPLEAPPVRLVGGVGSSAGEKHQQALPGAHVVKAFNTVGHALFFRPKLPGGPPTMFICGDDAGAKQKAGEICRAFGWEVLDVGGIDASHYLEAMCLVWVLSAFKSGNRMQAFKMLKE